MTKRLILLLIGLFFIAGIAVADPPEPDEPYLPFYGVTGAVTATTEAGELVPDRMIYFYHSNSPTQFITGESDGDGNYEINAYELDYYYDVPITFETEPYQIAVPTSESGDYSAFGTVETIYLSPLDGFTQEALVIIDGGWVPEGAPTAEGLTSLRASIVDDKVILDWIPVDGATGYNIYRGTEPYFVVEAASLIASEISGDIYDDRLEWEDPSGDGVNDSNSNYFYAATALFGLLESEISNRVGEYTYDLSKTSPTDYVWVSYVLDTSYSRTPITTLSEFGDLIPNVAAGYPQCFDVDTQQLLPTDHSLTIGEAIQIKITDSGVLQLTGGVLTTTFNLDEQAPTDYNWISLPMEHDPVTLADLADEIDNVAAGYPQYFDVGNQQPIGSEDLLYGGTPLQLKMEGQITWPSEE